MLSRGFSAKTTQPEAWLIDFAPGGETYTAVPYMTQDFVGWKAFAQPEACWRKATRLLRWL